MFSNGMSSWLGGWVESSCSVLHLQRHIKWHLVWTSILALAFSFFVFFLHQWKFAFSNDQCYWKADVANHRVIITEVLAGGVSQKAGIREGDELVSIDGVSAEPSAASLRALQDYIDTLPGGHIAVYRIRRAEPGVGASVDASAKRLTHLPVVIYKGFNYRMLIIMISGLVSWCLGLLVVLSSTNKITIYFYALGMFALMLPGILPGFLVASLPPAYMLPINVVELLLYAIAPPLWLHFFLFFPYDFEFKNKRRWMAVFYAVFSVYSFIVFMPRVVGFFVSMPLVDAFFADNKALFLWIRNILVGGALIGGMVLFWIGSSRLPREKRKVVRPAIIITAFIIVELLIYLTIRARLEFQSLLLDRNDWLFYAPLALIPLSFAYAILKNGFFDVQKTLARWLSFFVVLGLSLVLYVVALFSILTGWLPGTDPVLAGIALGLAALPAGWMLRYLALFIRKIFRRDLETARAVIMKSLRASRQMLSEDVLLQNLGGSLQEAFRPRLLLMASVEDGVMRLPEPSGGANIHPEKSPGGFFRFELPADLFRLAIEKGELVHGISPENAWVARLDEETRNALSGLDAQVMVLLVANSEPRTAFFLGGKYAELAYGEEDRDLLREVAQAASVILETNILHRQLVDQERIEQELQTARRIQEGLITHDPGPIPGCRVAMRLQAAFETGGDILWVSQRANGKWIAAVGDVSGKGLPAALFMSQAVALLRFSIQNDAMELEDILPALDKTLRNLMGRRDFLTLVLLEWDGEGFYRLARAGHPAPILLAEDGADVREIGRPGRGLGLRPASSGAWEIAEGRLLAGQWLILYTDGLTEAMDARGQLYGTQRLIQHIREARKNGSVDQACVDVFREVATFDAGNADDRTLFILEREALDSERL